MSMLRECAVIVPDQRAAKKLDKKDGQKEGMYYGDHPHPCTLHLCDASWVPIVLGKVGTMNKKEL